MWLTPKDNNKEFLCSGTGLGHLFLWKKCGYEFEEILVRQIDAIIFGMYNREILWISLEFQPHSSQQRWHGSCNEVYRKIDTFPKEVALAEEATVVVSGGEDGWVHVFDRTTGQVSQTLQHSKSGRVQMTHNTRSIHLILAATSSNEIETWISVWRKEAHTPPTPERCGELKLLSMLVTIVVVAILAIQIMTGSAKMGTMYGSMQKKSCLELHILQPRW
ncbi:hypothetical protein F5141DRAFT_1066094 [Pisolithus sp. B1]|nr:hypothetical protein F5141DRAFT_1066094 [Pisolithus sp. B1]